MNTDAITLCAAAILFIGVVGSMIILAKLKWAESIAYILNKYMGAISWICLLALAMLSVLILYTAGMTIYDPARMKNYFDNIWSALLKSLRSY